ncbi:MAG: hypothetical protein HY505_02710 [Candidatus Yanofskybacteria bacterium]|nr:hypothetical protein [Candidatus Yanofskybacteria bacterium]
MKEGLIVLIARIVEFFRNQWRSLSARIDRAAKWIEDACYPGPLSPEPEPLPEIKVGDVATNPRHTWIRVMNPKGRRTGNGFRAFGDSASIARDGKLTVVAVEDEQVLVSYASPRGQGYGAEAGNGTLFFVPKRVFATMDADYEMLRASEEEQKARIMTLLRVTVESESDPQPQVR